MFERRPIWGILIGLMICISIWRISIQEPSMLAAEYGIRTSGGGIIIDGDGDDDIFNIAPPKNVFFELQQQHQQQQQQIYGGKRLLARKLNNEQEQNESFGTDTETIKSSKFKVDISQSNTVDTNEKDKVNNATNINSKSNISKANSSLNNRKTNKTLIEFQKGAELVAPLPTSVVKSRQKQHQKQQQQQQQHYISKRRSSNTSDIVILPLRPTTKSKPAIKEAVTLASARTKLPSDDFQQLIDFKHFNYIMQQPDCDRSIFAPILVHSAPGNFQKRHVIRTTWASSLTSLQHNAALRVIFLLGAVNNETLQQQIEKENSLHADMVQGNFMDKYRNMTYKHVMAFKWFIYSCKNAQLLIKVDDDVFVNTPQILTYIQDFYKTTNQHNLNTTNHPSTDKLHVPEQIFHHPRNLLFCNRHVDARVRRTYRSKWRVSVSEYPGNKYPPYCPGYSIIYSADVVQRLYSAAQSTKYFWIDDVHVTGTLAQKINITAITSVPYELSKRKCKDVLKGKIAVKDLEFIFAWPDIEEKKIIQLWQLIKPNQSRPVTASAKRLFPSKGFR